MPIAEFAARLNSILRPVVLACAISLLTTACFDDDKSAKARDDGGSTPVSPSPPANQAPTIAGTPPLTATVNQAYSFQPSASDPDGDALTFSVTNKPAWATFDTKSGRLAGTPSSSSTGVFSNVRIAVSDGQATSTLAAFSITVNGTTLGSATLSWQPPTSNTDGTPLTNLAGYIVRYGTAPGTLDQQVRIDNPGIVTYVVADLTPATWYFQVAAFNTSGVESSPSATASKTIT